MGACHHSRYEVRRPPRAGCIRLGQISSHRRAGLGASFQHSCATGVKPATSPDSVTITSIDETFRGFDVAAKQEHHEIESGRALALTHIRSQVLSKCREADVIRC
ncbi:unnamed protein product [Cercospora beticola]|nr:unnamed protein product [Cercospora beticola]